MKIEVDSNKKYGVLLSGGLDSAILFYLLVKNCPTINLQPFTIPKYDGSALYADTIIDNINQKFNSNIPNTMFVGNPDAHHTEQSRTAIMEIFEKHDIDFLFMGVNKNPPELNDLPNAPKRKLVSPNPKLIYPFSQMFKDEIVEIMFNEGQEDLADITHTCTEQQIGRCNRCWQCLERIWAFEKLNKIDTGTK